MSSLKTGKLKRMDSFVPKFQGASRSPAIWGISGALFSLCFGSLRASPAQLWEQRHDAGTNNATGTFTEIDAHGNVVATGYSDRRYYTARYAAQDGGVIWEK